MTARYQVQCPRCQKLYPMPAAKLGDDTARATCGKCQHTFFLNAHLVPAQTTPTQAGVGSNSTTSPTAQPINPVPQNNTISNSTAHNTAAKAPPKKAKVKPVITEGMIHDDDDTDLGFDASELDTFMKNDVVINAPVVAATAKDNAQADPNDEAWLNSLLKDNNIVVDRSLNKQRPDDDLSDILGVDIDNIIPAAEPSAARQGEPDIYQKIQARLESHAPTQEQLAKKRPFSTQFMWLIGCILLIGLMGLQYIFFNADSLLKQPEYAAKLHKVCTFLPCNPPSADSSAFEITHQVRIFNAKTTNLLVTLNNTSADNQLYPNLKITFVGDNGVIGELIDYLTTPQRLLTSGQQKSLMLGVDLASGNIKTVNIEPFF
ncbi:MAG: zinc-ribbon domain-containing protein [Moraxella sp.]|nr:zinc-ribbon domain-containing protein [Moraxella sp.]